MKHILYLLFGLIISFSAMAQPTGGGFSTSSSTKKVTTSSKHLYQSKYTGLGLSFARGNLKEFHQGTWGLTANMGRIYYIESLESVLPEGFALGVDATFADVRMMLMKPTNVLGTSVGLLVNMGVRIGLAAGYSLDKSTSIDLYWDLLPNMSYVYKAYNFDDGSSSDEMHFSFFRGIPNALGLRLRHEDFNVNIELEGGHQKYSSNTYIVPQYSFNLRVGKCF